MPASVLRGRPRVTSPRHRRGVATVLPGSPRVTSPRTRTGKRPHSTPQRLHENDTSRQKRLKVNQSIKKLDNHPNSDQINFFSKWNPHQNITFNDVKQAATDTETHKDLIELLTADDFSVEKITDLFSTNIKRYSTRSSTPSWMIKDSNGNNHMHIIALHAQNEAAFIEIIDQLKELDVEGTKFFHNQNIKNNQTFTAYDIAKIRFQSPSPNLKNAILYLANWWRTGYPESMLTKLISMQALQPILDAYATSKASDERSAKIPQTSVAIPCVTTFKQSGLVQTTAGLFGMESKGRLKQNLNHWRVPSYIFNHLKHALTPNDEPLPSQRILQRERKVISSLKTIITAMANQGISVNESETYFCLSLAIFQIKDATPLSPTTQFIMDCFARLTSRSKKLIVFKHPNPLSSTMPAYERVLTDLNINTKRVDETEFGSPNANAKRIHYLLPAEPSTPAPPRLTGTAGDFLLTTYIHKDATQIAPVQPRIKKVLAFRSDGVIAGLLNFKCLREGNKEFYQALQHLTQAMLVFDDFAEEALKDDHPMHSFIEHHFNYLADIFDENSDDAELLKAHENYPYRLDPSYWILRDAIQTLSRLIQSNTWKNRLLDHIRSTRTEHQFIEYVQTCESLIALGESSSSNANFDQKMLSRYFILRFDTIGIASLFDATLSHFGLDTTNEHIDTLVILLTLLSGLNNDLFSALKEYHEQLHATLAETDFNQLWQETFLSKTFDELATLNAKLAINYPWLFTMQLKSTVEQGFFGASLAYSRLIEMLFQQVSEIENEPSIALTQTQKKAIISMINFVTTKIGLIQWHNQPRYICPWATNSAHSSASSE